MRQEVYTIVTVVLMCILTAMLAPGCDNAYLSPDTAAALSDQAVEREITKLNTNIEELSTNIEKQNALLTRIAVATERQAGITNAEMGR